MLDRRQRRPPQSRNSVKQFTVSTFDNTEFDSLKQVLTKNLYLQRDDEQDGFVSTVVQKYFALCAPGG